MHVGSHPRVENHGPRAIIVAPTRELTEQIAKDYTGSSVIRSMAIFGSYHWSYPGNRKYSQNWLMSGNEIRHRSGPRLESCHNISTVLCQRNFISQWHSQTLIFLENKFFCPYLSFVKYLSLERAIAPTLCLCQSPLKSFVSNFKLKQTLFYKK